jgi:hypothetical protein
LLLPLLLLLLLPLLLLMVLAPVLVLVLVPPLLLLFVALCFFYAGAVRRLFSLRRLSLLLLPLLLLAVLMCPLLLRERRLALLQLLMPPPAREHCVLLHLLELGRRVPEVVGICPPNVPTCELRVPCPTPG